MENIDYMELLNLIKDDKQPMKIRLHLNVSTGEYKEYEWCENCYVISNSEDESEDYNFYLRDCLLDSQSFDKIIEPLPMTIEAAFLTLKNRFYDLAEAIRNETNRILLNKDRTGLAQHDEDVKLKLLEEVINIVEEYEDE